MRPLTKRELNQLLRAAEMIETRQTPYSCRAIDWTVGEKWCELRKKYGQFYGLNHHSTWISDFCGEDYFNHRVLLILMFHAARGML
jgi:hypothetical protein